MQSKYKISIWKWIRILNFTMYGFIKQLSRSRISNTYEKDIDIYISKDEYIVTVYK